VLASHLLDLAMENRQAFFFVINRDDDRDHAATGSTGSQ
jgi:hypothetical protein